MLVDLDAVAGAQDGAAAGHAIERRGLERGETVVLLAEVFVDAALGNLVVALHRGEERVNGDVQALGELLERVGLDEGALLCHLVEHTAFLHEHVAHDDGEAGAAQLVKLDDVVAEVGVPHGVPRAVGLLAGAVHVPVVGAGLVHEALALGVHAQEGLGGGVELALVGELPAAGLLVTYEAAGRAGLGYAAVPNHAGGFDILLCADPHGGLDAHAGVESPAALGGGAAYEQGVQSLEHLIVARIAARGEQDVLGVDLHIAVLGGEDGARHGAVAVADELGEVVLVVDGVAGLADIVFEQLVAALLLVLLGLVLTGVKVVLRGRAEVVAAAGTLLVARVGLEVNVESVAVHDVDEPVAHLGGVVDPVLDDLLVHLAVGIAGELVEHEHGVGFLAGFLALRGVAHAVPVARGAQKTGLLADLEVEAEVRCRGSGNHAGVATANDEQVGLARLDDIGIGDLGRGAEPVDVGHVLDAPRGRLVGLGVALGVGGRGALVCHGGAGNAHGGGCCGGACDKVPAGEFHSCNPFLTSVRAFDIRLSRFFGPSAVSQP